MSETVICRSSADVDPKTVKRFRWERADRWLRFTQTQDKPGVGSCIWSRTGMSVGYADEQWRNGAADIFEWMPGCEPDRAAGKAAPTVERRLADGWSRVPDAEMGPMYPGHALCCTSRVGGAHGWGQKIPARYRGPLIDTHGNYVNACLACAPAAGVFADSPVTDARPNRESVPMCPRCQRRQFDCRCAVAAPQPAAPAPFKCAGAYCKTPDAPRATQSKMPIPPDWCVVCFDGLASAYMNAGGLEPDGPPPPRQPRMRDIYSPEMSEGADPDWVP